MKAFRELAVNQRRGVRFPAFARVPGPA